MKSQKGILLYLFLVLQIYSATSCEKESGSQLPPETHEGKNTFGCKVNGEVWIPTTDDFMFITMHSWYVIPENSIFINANISTKKIRQSIILEINNFSEVPKAHKLQDPNTPLSADSGYASFQIIGLTPEKKFFTNNLNSGKLIITKIDSVEQIASGRFEFEAIDSQSGETVKVTEGRFDVRYQRFK